MMSFIHSHCTCASLTMLPYYCPLNCSIFYKFTSIYICTIDSHTLSLAVLYHVSLSVTQHNLKLLVSIAVGNNEKENHWKIICVLCTRGNFLHAHKMFLLLANNLETPIQQTRLTFNTISSNRWVIPSNSCLIN